MDLGFWGGAERDGAGERRAEEETERRRGEEEEGLARLEFELV